jgi:hypothetical protein
VLLGLLVAAFAPSGPVVIGVSYAEIWVTA